MAKIGWAKGTCSRCNRTYFLPRPAFPIVCDCWLICPLCGLTMVPYTPPKLFPPVYWPKPKPEGTSTLRDKTEKPTINTLAYCESCDYYSEQPPVEVNLS